MLSEVSQMVADREAGTPGPWEVAEAGTYPDDEGAKVLGPTSANSRGNRVRYYVAQFCTRDASRIARLPDLEAAYLTLAAENATLRASEAAALERVTRMELALNGCIAAIAHADMADGVCCCGDNMEGHSEPMNCGHSPVDMGEYHAHQVLAAARQALTPTADKEPKT